MNFYKPVSNRPDFNAIEEEVIQLWKNKNIFRKSIDLRENGQEFIFYEGPPTANGRPGVHHVLTRTFKDLVCRYQTMRGKKVKRQAGWDEHGLPVEIEVQKTHDLKSKDDIEKMGVAKFNELCAGSTQKYIEEWEQLTERMAYWVDFADAYRTSDPKYIERVWGILKKLFDAGLLYKGFKIVPWACDSGTVVSQAEVALGYKDVVDETAYVKFQLSHESAEKILNNLTPDNSLLEEAEAKVYMLAWTTTPWTLPSNMALAVGPDIEYVVCRRKTSPPTPLSTNEKETGMRSEYIILSKKRWKAVLGESEWEETTTLNGEKLESISKYKNLFSSKEQRVIKGINQQKESFVIDDENSGTGIVHIAPAFGQDDFEAYKANNIQDEIINAVNPDGTFNSQAPDFLQGQSIFNDNKKTAQQEFVRMNKIICKYLDEKGLLFKTEKYEHSYPHNWRTNNPLIYYLRPSWYVATGKLKNKLIEANQQINWYPDHVKEGRFGQWLENNVDWAISRERYWGTPIPLWVGEKTGTVKAIGSFKELEEKVGKPLSLGGKESSSANAGFNPHKPTVDEICWEENGETFRRITEVLDCWFDSGSMPIASEESPRGQADYICEAVDQTRGWFYSLLAVAVSLQTAVNPDAEIQAPYKNVLCLGHILDKDAQKMSKSKGNVVNPWELFSQFGADPVRWFMVSAVSAGQPIRFDQAGISEVMRRFVLPLWNTYAFYILYANLDGVSTDGLFKAPGELVERQVKPIDVWIIARLNQTQLEVTKEFENYEFSKATQLIEKFVDDLSNVWVRANRSRFWNTSADTKGAEHKVDYSAYQTLQTCLMSVARMASPFTPMIAEAIYQNLKPSETKESIHLTDWIEGEESTDFENALLNEMSLAQEIINIGRSLRQELKIKIRQPLSQVIVSKNSVLKYFGELVLSELNVKEIVFAEQEEKVKLNTQLNEALLSEGLARELIHAIQNLRKSSGLEVDDRISLSLDFMQDNDLATLLNNQKEYISGEVLAINWTQSLSNSSGGFSKVIKINEKQVSITIAKWTN